MQSEWRSDLVQKFQELQFKVAKALDQNVISTLNQCMQTSNSAFTAAFKHKAFVRANIILLCNVFCKFGHVPPGSLEQQTGP